MSRKSLGAFAIAALATAPAMAQESQQGTLEMLEEQCRSIYHDVFNVFNSRFRFEKTKDETQEIYLADSYLETTNASRDAVSSIIDLAYDELAQVPANSASGDYLTRDIALTYYASCLGVIDS